MSPDGKHIYDLGADGVLTITSTEDFESETKGTADVQNFEEIFFYLDGCGLPVTDGLRQNQI